MATRFPYIVDPNFDLKDWRFCPCTDCGIVERYGPRVNEGHVGVRFEDWRPGPWRITLNGEDVSERFFAALAGENGWALLYHERTHMCPKSSRLSQHACKDVFWGECVVSLTQEIPEER